MPRYAVTFIVDTEKDIPSLAKAMNIVIPKLGEKIRLSIKPQSESRRGRTPAYLKVMKRGKAYDHATIMKKTGQSESNLNRALANGVTRGILKTRKVDDEVLYELA